MTEHFRGLSDIAHLYDGFIIDLWGVVHDGVTPYPGALECLHNLAGRKTLLLSNAPRRAASAQSMLRALGIADSLYSAILTSGEATWLALRDRSDPWFARLGTRVYHLGPQRDRNVLDGLDLTIADAPENADFMVNTGPDDDSQDPRDLATFMPELEACLAVGLPMICANPDRVVYRAGVRILCAGALAEYYTSRGGDVVSLGKPDPAIYRMALTTLNVPAGRILAIGDSLHTDIAGAAGAGIDSYWVLGGIHWDSLASDPSGASALAAQAGLSPRFALPRLVW
jgi:HAD superfamily hydrolase (TIGR01459 family)